MGIQSALMRQNLHYVMVFLSINVIFPKRCSSKLLVGIFQSKSLFLQVLVMFLCTIVQSVCSAVVLMENIAVPLGLLFVFSLFNWNSEMIAPGNELSKHIYSMMENEKAIQKTFIIENYFINDPVSLTSQLKKMSKCRKTESWLPHF